MFMEPDLILMEIIGTIKSGTIMISKTIHSDLGNFVPKHLKYLGFAWLKIQ